MNLSLRSIKTNYWSADNFKKHSNSMSCTLECAIQSCAVVSGYSFWQCSMPEVTLSSRVPTDSCQMTMT